MKTLATAFALIATPVMAQDMNKCLVVSDNHEWNGTIVTETANVKDHEFCLGFTPLIADIDHVAPSKDKPACVDITGQATGSITPVIYYKDGHYEVQDTMPLWQGQSEFKTLVVRCLRGIDSSIKFRGALKPQPL